ncbi:MAG: ABC transporter ATP-binding protein [Bacteroidetes bacterium]|nr:ABC transporter ATP-binding protein [Bacteroidota bacterium]
MSSLRSINPYFLKYKWHLLGGIIFVILSTVFAGLVNDMVGKATNVIVEAKAKNITPGLSTFVKYALLILGFALAKGVFMFFMRQTMIVMSRHIEFDQKNELYAHYQLFDASFFKQYTTGDMMNRISEDVGKVRMYTGPAIMYLVNTFATVVIVLIFMLQSNWKLTLLVLAPLPFLSYVIYRVSDLINKRSKIVQQEQSKLTSHAQETYSAVRVIKAYARENFYIQKLSDLNNDYKNSNLKLSIVEAMFQPVMVLMIGISVIATVWYGGRLVIHGEIKPGYITEFILHVYLLTWPFASLGWVTSLIQRAEASQARINEFLGYKPAIQSPTNGLTHIDGSIEFKNVSFTYKDSGIEALRNLSFKLEKGKTLGIMGGVGSGKTTIADLLVRLYDTSDGEILIDGNPIRNYDLHELRRHMAYVPQDVFLFSDTIRNNIAFSTGRTYSEQDIEDAARKAGVYDNIMGFPERFNTLVGERGVTLSGGQKQRISIARAILARPQIMIFDDCLSAVDAETEELILGHLKDVMKDKTCIIISHRESTLRFADKVINLDQMVN